MEHGKERLAEIFHAEKIRFLRFVRRKFDDISNMDAEDIVSEVTLSLLRRADIVGEIENLTAYIYRSLQNRILDHRRNPVSAVSLDEQTAASGEPGLQARGPTPDIALDQREMRERLLNAIGRLSPKERAIFLATEMDGRSFQELAEEWEEPVGTLLSRKSRAKAHLREMLSEYKK
jgi:RNA polymerase sigma factor (sigma-70 family)